MKKDVKYPILNEPPYAHAITNWDPEKRILTYSYNGRTTISISIPGSGIVDFRLSSDGAIVSDPLIQQHYVVVSEPVKACVTFQLTQDALNVRPERAGEGRAILGQVGRPLVYGSNAIYDINQDLLIDWNGADWEWMDTKLHDGGDGDLIARMIVNLSPSPWIINMKIHYYRRHLGFSYHKPWEWRPKVEPVSGWCSWEAYRREVSEDKMEEAASFAAKNFKSYGMKYIQLDDGFQPSQIPSSLDKSIADDWLSTNSKFPSGHKGNIDRIKGHGLEAGIWIYTYVHNEEYARKNPGFIKDSEGDPIEGDWLGFVADCLPETLERYVEPSFKGFRELGYTYIKTDGLRHLLYDGLHEAVRRGIITNGEAEEKFRAYTMYIRKALGRDIFYLSSWGVMSQIVGIADACRIATDVNPSWPHMRMQMVETARWFYTQRILFMNDPDHLCLRSKPEWAKSAISLCSLSGGLFMLSDRPDEYDDFRIDMIKKNLPPLKTYPAETGDLNTKMQAYTWTKAHGAAFVASRDAGISNNVSDEEMIEAAGKYPTSELIHPFSTLWAFHIETPAARWCVAARFATVPLVETKLEFQSLGLDPDGYYIAFDFWEQSYLGVFNKRIPCRKLPLGHCQIISLMPATGRPVFLASSRHVSMDAVSLVKQIWDGSELILELRGVPGTEENYFIHAPRNYSPRHCAVNNLEIPYWCEEEVIRASVFFEKEVATLIIKFSSSPAM